MTYDDVGEKPPNADGTTLPKVPELSKDSSSIELGNNHKSNRSNGRSSGGSSSELSETERKKKKKLLDMNEIQTKFEENLNNIKKNIDQVFNTSGSSTDDDDESMKQGSTKDMTSKSSSDVASTTATSTPAVVSDSEGPGAAPETPQQGAKQLTTSKSNNICGIKTTKRAIDDGYTITVCRRLLENKTKIIMISKVEFDDPKKENIEAKQIFERIER